MRFLDDKDLWHVLTGADCVQCNLIRCFYTENADFFLLSVWI